MFSIKLYKSLTFLLTTLFVLNGCNGKLPGADARKYPADPKKRIEQNIKEGKAFRLMDLNNNNLVELLNLRVQMNYGELH